MNQPTPMPPVPQTLGDVNAILEGLGFAKVRKAGLDEILQRIDRAQFVTTLRLAGRDANAQIRLMQLGIERVGGAARPAEEPAAPREERERKERRSIHVYGTKGALCWEEDETRGGEPTVSLDAALASGPKQFDWQSKVRIQLTREELPVIAAVLLGVQPGAEFKNHGAGNDKGFSVRAQPGGFFVRVWEGDKGLRAVPMGAPDAYYVATLFLRQLRAASPWMDAQGIIATLRAMFKTAPAQQGGQQQGGHHGAARGG